MVKTFFILSITLFLFIPVYAQIPQSDAESALRETDRFKQKEKIEEELKIPAHKAEEPKKEELPLIKKEEKKFFVSQIHLRGCETFSEEEFYFLIGKYKNRELGLSDLNALCKEIEAEYLKRGLISAVFIPRQEIEQDSVVLQVVEARMGNLEIAKHAYFKKERLAYYWKIKPDEILRYDKMLRGLQMMNKNLDREVKATLHAGAKPGTTDVLLTPETQFPLHFMGSFDNEGTVATGRSRTGLGIRHNNFLGRDDTLISGYTFGRDFSGTYNYHLLPLNYAGTALLSGYSRSVSHPTKEFTAYGLHSQAKISSLSLRHDIYKKEKYFGSLSAGFEAKDKTTWANTGVYNRDRLRIFNVGGNFIFQDNRGTTSFSPEFSQGVDAFGASPKVNPLASRNAKPVFSKLNLELQHKGFLPFQLQANIRSKAQVASTKLTPQEAFTLGGIDSVRGYPDGDYLADNAVSTSMELLIPSIFLPYNWRLPYAEKPLREQISSLIFIDYGWGKRRGALAAEKHSVNLVSAGCGLRFNLFNQFSLRLEWGFPLAGNRAITEAGDSQFHFSIDFQEKLPEEIKRIRLKKREKQEGQV